MSKSENATFVANKGQFDDELSLLDLIAFVQKNIRVLLSGALIGGVLGLVITFVLPEQWEASALVRVGQFGSAEGVGRPIEPLLLTLDRIKGKSFQDDVLKSLGIGGEEAIKFTSYYDSLKVKLEKSESISIALRGTSPNEVKRNMNAVVHQLKNIHIRMAKPTLDRWHQELASIDAELEKASIEAERLTKLMNRQPEVFSEKSFPQAVLLNNILITREGGLRSMRDRKRILEEQLSPERTFDTDILGQVAISAKPVFPKKSLFTIAGCIVGLFLAVLLSITGFIGSRKSASIK